MISSKEVSETEEFPTKLVTRTTEIVVQPFEFSKENLYREILERDFLNRWKGREFCVSIEDVIDVSNIIQCEIHRFIITFRCRVFELLLDRIHSGTVLNKDEINGLGVLLNDYIPVILNKNDIPNFKKYKIGSTIKFRIKSWIEDLDGNRTLFAVPVSGA